MLERLTVVVSFAALAVAPSQAAAQSTSARIPSSGILGEWRFVRAQVAPWAKATTPAASDAEHWIGRTIRFEPHRVAGPGVLRCANAVYTPTRFSVGTAAMRGDAATVPVRFTDGRRARIVRCLLRRQRGGWRVDDLRYENSETILGWLE